MERLKKSERVQNYLEQLLEQDNFGLEELEALKYKDILNAKELKGIGDRTISNTLNQFKEAKGIKPNKRKVTKKKIVEDYLDELWETGKVLQGDLQGLRYDGLKDKPELSGVGKTTLTCALAEFKKKHNKKTFEKGILDFLAREKETIDDQPDADDSSASNSPALELMQSHEFLMNIENIRWIKKMIREFEKKQTLDEEKQVYELRELKHALNFVGINPQKIVRKYWEDVSKDFMNKKVLSGNIPGSEEVKLKSYL